jgi:hypothetical protein
MSLSQLITSLQGRVQRACTRQPARSGYLAGLRVADLDAAWAPIGQLLGMEDVQIGTSMQVLCMVTLPDILLEAMSPDGPACPDLTVWDAERGVRVRLHGASVWALIPTSEAAAESIEVGDGIDTPLMTQHAYLLVKTITTATAALIAEGEPPQDSEHWGGRA